MARPDSDVILSLPGLEPTMIGLPISADCPLPYLILVVMLGLDEAVMYKSIVVTNTYNQILGSVGYGFLANSYNKKMMTPVVNSGLHVAAQPALYPLL